MPFPRPARRRRRGRAGARAAGACGPRLGAAVERAAAKAKFRRRCRSRRCSPARRSRSRCARRRSPCCRAARRRCGPTRGSFPGPTIRRPAGEPTEVTFVHKLPTKAGELTVHLHGGHNRSSEDGQPGGLTRRQPRALYCRISDRLAPGESGNDLLIAPGGRRTYVYDLIEDGAPERAAFQWYHDHRLERTAPNVWRGLAGMLIIDDEFDAVAAAAARRSRHPADDHRPLASTSRTSSPTRSATPPTPPTTGSVGRSRSSTASTSPTTRSAPPATACGSSTPPTSASTTSSSPTATS